MTQFDPPTGNIGNVWNFIIRHWDDTIRFSPEDSGTLIGLPYPYTIPSRKDIFQEIYYWDTYFTSLGLIGTGRTEQALNNARDLLALAERFGFVPNGNRTFYLKRSQLAYLGPLVGIVGAALSDAAFCKQAAPILEREYNFWAVGRLTPAGLSRPGNSATREELLEFYDEAAPRREILGRPKEACIENLSHAMAECEIWDFNPRFDDRARDFCPVDLNSNLYLYELQLAQWGEAAGRDQWMDRAAKRKAAINDLCWDKDQGAYFDYDFVNRRRSPVLAASTFQPLWAGLADQDQADLLVRKALPKLEFPFGLSTGVPDKRNRTYQWAYPNLWPCLQHVAYRGLVRYGYIDEARRIARKYIDTVCRGFEATGDLWEKYNAADGSTNTVNEASYGLSPEVWYDSSSGSRPEVPQAGATPSMMGWTAGVFVDAVLFLQGDPNAPSRHFADRLLGLPARGN